MRRLLLSTLLALAACPKAPEAAAPPPPPPAPLPRVPPGCEQNLAGTYRHQDDESFRYALSDDGTVIHVRAYRQFGATEKSIASAAAEFELRRTPEGLRGAAATQAPTLSGKRTCNVLFPYEVTACTSDTLTLRTVHQIKLGEDCQPEDPLHPDFVENVLLRLPPPDAGAPVPPDAGVPSATDAGAAPDAGAPTIVDAGLPPMDAGAPPPVDGGALIDAGVVTQGVGPDAGTVTRP